MLLYILTVLPLALTVYGAGEFLILHHPSSLLFKGHETVKESTLKEVYTAALGLTIKDYSNWQGMYIDDPFNLAKGIVTISVDGVKSVGQVKGHNFPLQTDVDDYEIYSTLTSRISQRFPEVTSQFVHINLANGLEDLQQYDFLQNIKNDKPQKNVYSFLKTSVDEDRNFLTELNLLNSISEKISNSLIKESYFPDVFWFKFSSLHALNDLHGENSTVVKEAKRLLNEATLQLKNAFIKAYGSDALITVITSDTVHTRKTRAADPGTGDQEPVSLNLAEDYDENYPIIFNIMLWLSVALIFSLLAISLATGNMDPGRDSIIYRMTSTKLKKEN